MTQYNLRRVILRHVESGRDYPVGKIASLKECTQIQCHIVKNTLPQTAMYRGNFLPLRYSSQ